MRLCRVSAPPPPPPAAALSAPVRVRKWCRRLNYAEALNMPVGASIDLDLAKEQEMIAAGLGPRAFRHHAVDHSHTGPTTSDHRPFNSAALVSMTTNTTRTAKAMPVMRPQRSLTLTRAAKPEVLTTVVVTLLPLQPRPGQPLPPR